MVALFTMP